MNKICIIWINKWQNKISKNGEIVTPVWILYFHGYFFLWISVRYLENYNYIRRKFSLFNSIYCSTYWNWIRTHDLQLSKLLTWPISCYYNKVMLLIVFKQYIFLFNFLCLRIYLCNILTLILLQYLKCRYICVLCEICKLW